VGAGVGVPVGNGVGVRVLVGRVVGGALVAAVVGLGVGDGVGVAGILVAFGTVVTLESIFLFGSLSHTADNAASSTTTPMTITFFII
jgi:hypothetical protein